MTMLPPGASESRAAQKAALAGEPATAASLAGGGSLDSFADRARGPGCIPGWPSPSSALACYMPPPVCLPPHPLLQPIRPPARLSHPNPFFLPGVLHEKQTEAELGELLRRLEAANLEGELDEFELVGSLPCPLVAV